MRNNQVAQNKRDSCNQINQTRQEWIRSLFLIFFGVEIRNPIFMLLDFIFQVLSKMTLLRKLRIGCLFLIKNINFFGLGLQNQILMSFDFVFQPGFVF